MRQLADKFLFVSIVAVVAGAADAAAVEYCTAHRFTS